MGVMTKENIDPAIDDKVISSLALLHSAILPRDYISTFIPFVATMINNKHYASIDVSQICNDFKNEYGFAIPRAPMTSILSRCVTEDLIKKEANGVYIPILENIHKRAFTVRQKESTHNYSVIINRFIRFVNLYTSGQIIIDRTDAERIFLNFLENNSAMTLTSEYFEQDLETLQETERKRNLFLMARFIQECYANDLVLYSKIKELALAHLIAAAITYDREPETSNAEFADIVIYLDTPLVLRLIGLQTDEMQHATKELFEVFNEVIHPKYYIFSHTYDEILNILQDCLYWIENPKYNVKYANDALMAFIKKKYTKFDISNFISKLETLLTNEYDIEIDESTYYNSLMVSYQIDERFLTNKLIETYHKEPNLYSINYDVQSISSIIKLRAGRSLRSYKKAKYLFLTSNSTLAYVSRKYASEYNKKGKGKAAPCVTDYFLGTTIWLSTSIKKLENYSEAKLLADCYAATAPSSELISKFVDSFERLKSEGRIDNDDYLLLRSQTFTNSYLENRTLNEEYAFSDKTTEEILEDIKHDIAKPYLEELKHKESEIDYLKSFQENVNQQNEKRKEKAQKYEDDAIKGVNKLANLFIPIPLAFIILFLSVSINLFSISPSLKIILQIISSLCAFLSTLAQILIRNNIYGIKHKLIATRIRQMKVKDYKNNLDAE